MVITRIKNSQNLLIKKKFENSKNIKFGKLLKIGALKLEKKKQNLYSNDF